MPTEVVSTIGTGGDYATIALWEAATTIDLVAADEIQIGELLNEEHTLASTVTVTGATTDATRYRVLRAQSGAEYDPITGTGALLRYDGATGNAIELREEGCQFLNFGIVHGGTTSASKSIVRVTVDATNANGVGCLLDGLTIFTDRAGTDLLYAIRLQAEMDFPATVRNCVVYDDAGTTAADYGIAIQSTQVTTVSNCVFYGTGDDGILLAVDSADHTLQNVVSAGNAGSGIMFTGTTNVNVDYCATDDATADDAGGTGNVINIVVDREFVDPLFNDFHVRAGGDLAGAGADLSASFTTDLEGEIWTTWSIGAYATINAQSPLERVHTIGSGEDYATIAAWEAATDNDLVSADVIEIGELVTGDHTISSAVTIAGATTDATRYRVLRAQSGAEYDPITGTGAVLVSTSGGYTILGSEEGLRLEGFGIEWTAASPTAARSAVHLFSDATNSNGVAARVTGVTVIANLTSSASCQCFGSTGATYPLIARNCIAIGTGLAGGVDNGFNWQVFAAGSEMSNCVAYEVDNRGIIVVEDTASSVRNCVSVGAPTTDFLFSGGTTNLTLSGLASEDATATGTGAITSIVAADEFVDPANNDFRLKGTGQLFGAGTDLSADFTTDIAGDTWGPWSIGAYRATSLEVWSNGAWGPADPLTGVNQGRVTYYRWTKQQAQNADSDPIPTAGATKILAYLGTVTSGSGASDGLRINPLPYPRASATLEPDIPVAAGKRHIAGVVNTSTAASNKAAVCFAPSGAASIYLRNLDTTSSPIIDIVIEVHR